MSFFGFDTALPPDGRQRSDRHNTAAPGFAQPQDAFAAFTSRANEDEGEALDFEQTYDGLGDQLEESGDTFNDDTFGDAPATQENVGKDFDFFGSTDRVAQAMREEQMRYNAGRVVRPMAAQTQQRKPARTGYEGYIPQLEANASIWGLPEKKVVDAPQQTVQGASGARKVMTLDEIEAAMRGQPQAQQPQVPQSMLPPMQHGYQQQPFAAFGVPPGMFPQQFPIQSSNSPQPPSYNQSPQILLRPQQHAQQLQQPGPHQAMEPVQAELPGQGATQPTQILQRQRPDGQMHQPQRPDSASALEPENSRPLQQPRQILQNPNRLSGQGMPMAPAAHPGQMGQRQPPTGPAHQRGPSYGGPIITSPQQILQLSVEDRAAFLEEEARRAKRNHKIALMAKYNGIMTPQDKYYVSRIQLTQLMSNAGMAEDSSQEAKLNEDFYYQVHSQIRGASRQNPHQPASQFALTYLFQTGNRYGGGRRHHRGGDNHMQRMEQQVQRAVEYAKSKPKAKALDFEGSLGKISFSNAKAPRAMLNLKVPEGDQRPTSARRQSRHHDAAAERRETLKDIERVFRSLMLMEDHERQRPPRLVEGAAAALIQAHMDWRERLHQLNQQLWNDLKVMEPIVPNSPVLHPFIAILSFAKGKKLLPRVWRHIDDQQRLTVLTLIAVHLDSLDVVARALPPIDQLNAPLPLAVREEVELFSTTVTPILFLFLNEAQLPIIVGLLGLILDRSTIPNLVRTKVGTSILTMLISRVELLKSSAQGQLQPSDLEQWSQMYNRLFDLTEPALPFLFGNISIHEADDVHVWQFLAAMGAAANPEQQQRLVIGVKERVMETVRVSRSLPGDLAGQRLGHVNLFMRAIGLDVELLD